MNTDVRRGVVVALLVLCAACGGSGPASPTRTPSPPVLPPTTQPPLIEFPPATGPSRTFIFQRELKYPVGDYTGKSRLVLYDNGAFELHYPNLLPYRGGYQDPEADGVVTFMFEGSRYRVGISQVDATGSLKGDSLTVEYSLDKQLSDFENAVYVLMP